MVAVRVVFLAGESDVDEVRECAAEDREKGAKERQGGNGGSAWHQSSGVDKRGLGDQDTGLRQLSLIVAHEMQGRPM
jgi:hypothetical protein